MHSITVGSIDDTSVEFQRESTEDMRGQQVWALIQNLHAQIRDAAGTFFDNNPSDIEFGEISAKIVAFRRDPSPWMSTSAYVGGNWKLVRSTYAM